MMHRVRGALPAAAIIFAGCGWWRDNPGHRWRRRRDAQEGPGGQPVAGGTTALGGYTCGPTTLEIDPPEIAGGLLPFPTDWSKAG